MTGRTISHFEILEKLGEGGMGVVYKARDAQLGRIVAIKALPGERVHDPERRKRFVQEARAASALNHPNIVTIHEIFQADGTDFIVMEFVQGKTLDHLITRRGLRVSDALKCSVQIADALAKAHAAGIVHRDLKPANVMVSDDGRVKILDFGLAKLSEPAPQSDEREVTVTRAMDSAPRTEEGALVGTVAYMSPEQAEGRTVDARSDIFSFGAVLYEMLSGHRAFDGTSKMATLASVMREEPKRLGELSPGVPRDLEKLVSRCLRKDPERRAQHMSDLRLALEELKEETESGVTSGTSITPGKPARKRTRWWIAATCMLMLISAALALLLRRPTPVAPPLRIMTLTSYAGIERHPTLSPDGKQVAFSWDGDTGGNFDLYVKLVDAGTPVRLTQNPQNELSPAWSPDGRFIAFSRIGPNTAPGAYFVIPALGGSERKIADIPLVPIHQPPPYADWTADGKALVITDTSFDPPALTIVSIDTLSKKPLTKPPSNSMGDIRPRVSPDGKSVAFVRAGSASSYDWLVVPIDGSAEPRAVTHLGGPIGGGAWTPDGSELVFSAQIEGLYRLVRTRIDGTSPPTTIPEAGTDVIEPSLARQSGRLAYSTGYSDMNLWKTGIRSQSTQPVRIAASTKREFSPDFSPDGTKLVFVSGRSGEEEVWTADADGSNPFLVTNEGGRPAAPRWSPDGKQIAFAKRPGGNADVYVVDAGGGSPRRLTTDPASDATAYWSRDGKWIYFASNRTGRLEVWKIPSDGSAREVQVTRNGGWRSRESLDARTLYYQKLDAPGLWRMPVGGGPEEKVSDIAAGYTWDAPGRDIFYLDASGLLSRLDAATGRVTTLPKVDGIVGGLFNFAVSSDGHWLVYAWRDQQVNDLMLIENFR